jgi:spermidine synthase
MEGNEWFIDRDSRNRLIYHRVKRSILNKKTKYQKVEIFDTFQFGRIVVLDGKIQSAERDEFIYHEALVHPIMITHPKPENILILGGGEGATLKEVLKHNTVKSVLMIDIDKEFVELCRKYLRRWHMNTYRDKRVNIIYEDAFKYLKENKLKADIIIADISDPASRGPTKNIYNKAFFTVVKDSLQKDGMFVTHATAIEEWKKGDVSRKIFKIVKDIFPISSAYYEYIPSFGCLWAYVIGSFKYNPESLSTIQVRKAIQERDIKELGYYSPEAHKRLFSLPKNIIKYFSS